MFSTVKKHNLKDSRGFTIIEMAIVTMIIGLVFASAAQLLTQRQQWVQKENTRLAVISANAAISNFRDTFGRYPCPASLTAVPGDADYGIESDCDDTSVAVGAGIGPEGYAITAGQRTVAYNDRATDPPTLINEVPRVRTGALPFKTLNMDETEMVDGYRNRIIYAVTEPLAVAKKFASDAGAIAVLNDQGASVIAPGVAGGDTAIAHFALISSGENGAGGFTQEGTRLACAAAGANQNESVNCDFDVDSVFQIAQTSSTANGSVSAYDDLMVYATHEDIPLWEKNPADVPDGAAGENDVAMKTIGNMGIGRDTTSYSASKTPDEELQVDGIVIARDDPYTPEVEGNVQSENICEYDSGTTTCFPSSLIAGELAAGGGMECPAGQYMVGIRDGAPICRTEVRIECPGGSIATGIDSNGELECSDPPPPGCPTVNVNLCSETEILPASDHGQRRDISVTTSAGGTRYARYQCDSGSWDLVWTWGDPCDCTASTGTPRDVSCRRWSSCGNRYSGTRTIQTNFVCPEGRSRTITLDDSGCTCLETSRERQRSCPSGFNGGRIFQRNTHDCSATPPRCSGWIEYDRTCSCTPETDTRTLSCPSGLTGEIRQERNFTCPGGSTNPGVQGGWTTVSNTCTCVPSSRVESRSCPISGHSGTYRVRVNFNCPSATYSEEVIENTCVAPPPIPYYWRSYQSGSPTFGPSRRGPQVGDRCDESEAGDRVNCHTVIGSGTYGNFRCQCRI